MCMRGKSPAFFVTFEHRRREGAQNAAFLRTLTARDPYLVVQSYPVAPVGRPGLGWRETGWTRLVGR